MRFRAFLSYLFIFTPRVVHVLEIMNVALPFAFPLTGAMPPTVPSNARHDYVIITLYRHDTPPRSPIFFGVGLFLRKSVAIIDSF